MAAERYVPKSIEESEAKIWLDAMRWSAKVSQTEMPETFYHSASGEVMLKDGSKYRPQTPEEYLAKPFSG